MNIKYVKYPWISIVMTVTWIATVYVILAQENGNYLIVFITGLLTVIILAFIGFRSPKR